VIVVVRAEVPPLMLELLDVRLEGGQRERVECQDVLGVLGLAVRHGRACPLGPGRRLCTARVVCRFFDLAFGEQLGVQRVTDRSVDLLDVALPDVARDEEAVLLGSLRR